MSVNAIEVLLEIDVGAHAVSETLWKAVMLPGIPPEGATLVVADVHLQVQAVFWMADTKPGGINVPIRLAPYLPDARNPERVGKGVQGLLDVGFLRFEDAQKRGWLEGEA